MIFYTSNQSASTRLSIGGVSALTAGTSGLSSDGADAGGDGNIADPNDTNSGDSQHRDNLQLDGGTPS